MKWFNKDERYKLVAVVIILILITLGYWLTDFGGFVADILKELYLKNIPFVSFFAKTTKGRPVIALLFFCVFCWGCWAGRKKFCDFIQGVFKWLWDKLVVRPLILGGSISTFILAFFVIVYYNPELAKWKVVALATQQAIAVTVICIIGLIICYWLKWTDIVTLRKVTVSIFLVGMVLSLFKVFTPLWHAEGVRTTTGIYLYVAALIPGRATDSELLRYKLEIADLQIRIDADNKNFSAIMEKLAKGTPLLPAEVQFRKNFLALISEYNARMAELKEAARPKLLQGQLNKNILVPFVIILLGIILACFKDTRKVGLILASVALVLWFWIGAKTESKLKLTLQEEKGCEQRIVRLDFKAGDVVIPTKVDGGSAFWGDGRPMKEGTGRPVLDPPPLRICITDPNMIVSCKVWE